MDQGSKHNQVTTPRKKQFQKTSYFQGMLVLYKWYCDVQIQISSHSKIAAHSRMKSHELKLVLFHP